MFESMKNSLATWDAKTSERVKLQHAYIIVAVVLVIIAGVVGLMNRNLGQNILIVAIISAALFLANAVAWSLLQSALLMRLTSTRRTSSTRKK